MASNPATTLAYGPGAEYQARVAGLPPSQHAASLEGHRPYGPEYVGAAPAGSAWVHAASPNLEYYGPASPTGQDPILLSDQVDLHSDYPPIVYEDEWTAQFFPDGLIYRSYLAGAREPRFSSTWGGDQDGNLVWDSTLGARFGLWRYGTQNDVRPEGWQIDMEGAAFPRLDPVGVSTPLIAVDFRFGIPITYASGRWQYKTGYYHISSHLGDEYMIATPNYVRHNFSRDAIMLGIGYFWTDEIRLYGEVTWADWADSRGGLSEPWEFQFGIDYVGKPFAGRTLAPFAAVNTHLRQEHDFGGNVVLQAGWAWPRGKSGQLWRVGGEYYDGKSPQGSFYDKNERRLSAGLWYDF